MDDFGGKLRQARERRGISLRQIAASTKISAAALEALERDDISKLPGGIFSRAFVRAYAVEVGLDPDDTVREFLERFNQKAPPDAGSLATSIPEAEAEFENRQRAAARVVTIAAIAVPVLAAGLYFAYRSRGARQAQREPTAASLPVADVARAAAASPPPDRASPPAAPLVAAGQMMLDLHPTSDCWVSLTVDGRKLFARVMKGGERESHPVAREAVVEIGDAGAFAFAIDGREGRQLGDKGRVTTLRVTPATARQYLR